MQPLNYCRKLLKHIKENVEASPLSEEIERDFPGLWWKMKKELRDSVKFLMPHGGILLEDHNVSALDEGEQHLPFRSIALEFTGESVIKGKDRDPNLLYPVKFLVLAWEEDAYYGGGIMMLLGLDCGDGMWRLYPCGVLEAEGIERVGGEVGYCLGKSALGTPQWIVDIVMTRLLGFLNALACSNVETSRLPRKKVHRLTKAGKQFDDYHVLVIKRKEGEIYHDKNGTHASPREHIRRGHIRRIGSKKIWVCATVVNPGIGATVRKDYEVRV